jgi:phospholipase D1/2
VGRNALIDQSIHHAYVHQIRAAKSFIVIDNQYFLGSSHLWDSGQRGGFASHLIPIELAEKICAKIRAGERFAVYVTVPLYPEGTPTSQSVQELLRYA